MTMNASATRSSSSSRGTSARVVYFLLGLAIACVLLVNIESVWFWKHNSAYISPEPLGNAPPLLQSTPTKQEENVLSKHYNVCIVGAGLSGAVIAERYANVLQQDVLVLEKRHHIGGNCYDYIDDDTNIRVSKYGAHLFHTYHKRVWDYVHRFSSWTRYEHRVLGLVENKHVPIPVNIDTVNALFDLNISSEEEMNAWLEKEQVKYDHDPKNSEEMALSRVGPRLYNYIFKPYTFKQWAKYPAELGPEVTARIPVRNDWDDRYFSDPFQALPTHGYTALFERLLDSRHIVVRTNTDYFQVQHQLKCDRLYYTGPIDAYFAHVGWPKLEYRSLDFERVVKYNTTYFQPVSVVNHPQPNDDFTRIVEYKHLLNQSSPHTIYFIERSKDGGEPYYPVPNTQNQDLYRKYQKMAEKEQNVTFVGRLANYKYFNMDQAILNALELFDQDTGVSEQEQWVDLSLMSQDENKVQVATEMNVRREKTANETKMESKPKSKEGQNETAETEAESIPEQTHWCIISKEYSMKFNPNWFDHFPHSSEVILPCWSWFRRQNATKNCGFLLMDGLKFDKDNTNTWQQQLVRDVMKCQVQEFDTPLDPKKLPLSDGIQHIPNLQRIRPRYNHRMYLERPEDAHALRRLVISDHVIEKLKGNTLQIGLIQRTTNTRMITNLDEIQTALETALPDANITQSTLEGFSLPQQAEYFATKDVIVGAHGAALTNAVFCVPGTIVVQVYPSGYFYQSLDPLIEQTGAIAIDWFDGEFPMHDFFKAVKWRRHDKYRQQNITPPPKEIVDKVLGALGLKTVSADMLVGKMPFI